MMKLAVRLAALFGLVVWPPVFLLMWLFFHKPGDNFFHEFAEGGKWLINRLKDGAL